MTGRLAGKVAIITGGAGGIGAATGELFRAQGAQVALTDRDECDVTDPGQVAGVVSRTVERFGRLDVLVNNAAVRAIGRVDSADAAAWADVLEVNVIGAVNFCRAALPDLRKAGRSSVVNVSSCYAGKARKDFGAYDASKAALLALTRTLAAEEAAHGVRVNAVCPGGTITPFTIGRQAARGVSIEAMRGAHKPDTLLGRWAESIEIAWPILWLASDEASYVTGAVLMVDGGCSVAS